MSKRNTGPARVDLAAFSCKGAVRGKGEIAETFTSYGAPGWDRTSNPCLRRAVLYPLSYGRLDMSARLWEPKTIAPSKTESIPGFT